MEEKNCFRCGKELLPGGLFYVVHIRIFSGFNGILMEPEEGIDKQLKDLIEQVEHSDPEAMEKDVHEEIVLMVCKSCRDRLVDEIQHPWEGPFRIRRGPDSLLH
jgi:hypothetical protein